MTHHLMNIRTMGFSMEESPPHIRAPSYILPCKSSPDFQAPVEDLFKGSWFLIRSCNTFWKDKRNVRLEYTPAPTGSHIEDQAFYQTMGSDTFKSMDGRDTQCEGEVGTYIWQGKGFMRIASARWEVLCFTSRPESGDWMLVFAYKSIFTAPAINLLCRSKTGLTDSDMRYLEQWLQGVKDDQFQRAVRGMVYIQQD